MKNVPQFFTIAGKAPAEDPRRVGFSSVADSMKNELQFFTVARGKRPHGAIPDGGLPVAIPNGGITNNSLNSSYSQCVFTFTIIYLIFLNFLYAWGSLTFSVGKINFCIVSYVIHFLHIMILKYNKGT